MIKWFKRNDEVIFAMFLAFIFANLMVIILVF